MKAAGITEFGGAPQPLQLPDPRRPRSAEVLIEVRAAGVGNWDDVVRTGEWDTGARPPMALGVEAAGVVAAVGQAVSGLAIGDRVATHDVPFLEQGCWATYFLAAAQNVALLPASVPFDVAAALPVPVLTADQAVAALAVGPDDVVLVHGAGGVTGAMLVQLAAHRGACVMATAGQESAVRLRAMGATAVLDYHQSGWPIQLRELTGGGANKAVNAVSSGASVALSAVKDGGALATITSGLPGTERGICMQDIVVAPDGQRLHQLALLMAAGTLTLAVGRRLPLDRAGEAIALVKRGTHGQAVVLELASQEPAEATGEATAETVLAEAGDPLLMLAVCSLDPACARWPWSPATATWWPTSFAARSACRRHSAIPASGTSA